MLLPPRCRRTERFLSAAALSTVLGVTRNSIARLNTDGTLDIAFNPNANDAVHSIAVQADGKILVGGAFTGLGGGTGTTTRNRIGRLDPDGTLDSSLSIPALTASVFALAVQADGKILVGGFFTTLGGGGTGTTTRNHIGRLESDGGTLDASFNPGANDNVLCAGGASGRQDFSRWRFRHALGGGGTTARNRIGRLNPDGTLDTSFNPGANGTVTALAVQADGKVLVGGIVYHSRRRRHRHGPPATASDGLIPTARSIPASIPVRTALSLSLGLQTDGKILVGGLFTTLGGGTGTTTRNRIGRLNPTGTLDSTFDPGANGTVFTLGVQADGKILAGGDFTGLGGGTGTTTRDHIGRLTNTDSALQQLAVTTNGTTIFWSRNGASPEVDRVTLELSTDASNYTALANPSRVAGGWQLTGQILPTQQNIFIRARGFYSTGEGNGSGSIVETVRNAFISPSSTLGNISTRLRVETGDNVLIGGFIITGTQPKKVMVRAIGPSLPLAGVLADPTLELHDGAGTLIASNDNWMDAPNKQEIIDSTISPTNDLESAILMTLEPGLYTAIVHGVNNTTGIGLVEVYDLDLAADSILANISTRGLVQTGDDVMIGGIIILGTDPQEVLLRAIGPSLPVAGALADPTLELHDKDGVIIASNNNWRSDQEADIIATTIPPTDDAESAILMTLVPDAYTAIVRGKDDTTGIALVEAYQLDN